MRFFFLLPFFLLSFASAHRGFERLAWQENADAYTLSVLGDFHLDGEGDAQLFVQLSQGGEVVPENTRVDLGLSQQDSLIYEGEVPFLTDGSNDGKTFYSGYLATFPLTEAGLYDVALSVQGPAGRVSRSYSAVTQQGVSWPEYLPSILILSICAAGVAILFMPIKRKDVRETLSKPDAHP